MKYDLIKFHPFLKPKIWTFEVFKGF